MGLNLLTGYNGQVSIGHGAFFGVGAYTTALLMDHQSRAGTFLPDAARRARRVVRSWSARSSASRRCGSRACTSRSSRSASRCCSPTSRTASCNGTGGTNLRRARRRARSRPPSWCRRSVSRPRRAHDQWAYYDVRSSPRSSGSLVRLADRAQPLRPGADRGARPRSRGRDGRHQHRPGEGDRVRAERAVRRHRRVVLGARRSNARAPTRSRRSSSRSSSSSRS